MNPNRILYWLGGGLLLLLVGVLVLVKLAPSRQGGPPPDPERTMIWLYDAANPEATAQVMLLEESRAKNTLSLVAFPAPPGLQATFGGSHAAKAQEQLAAQVGRKVHHRVFLPYSVVTTLVDAAQGIRVNGRELTGAEAIAQIRGGGDMGSERAARVMLALADAVARHGLDMSASDGFRLARQVDTDIDLTQMPDLLTRWSRYGSPSVQSLSAGNLTEVQRLLAPDRP